MRSVVKGLAMLLAACGAVILTGCDSESNKADRQAKADLKQAIHERSIRSESHQDAAKQALESAAKATAASAAVRAQANAMLAQQRADAALVLLRQIDHKELELSAVAFELSQLAVQLDTGNILVTNYNQYDPKPARDQILAKIAEAQGGPDKSVWFQNEKSVIPTLAAVKQKISQLESDLAKLQDESKSLTDQRTGILSEAEAAGKSADAVKGEKSVAEFKRSSELRKKAGGLFTQIDQINAKMAPLQRDLEIAQGQQDVLNDVIKQLQSQLGALDVGWQSIRQQLAAQQALARQIVGGSEAQSPTTGPVVNATIAAKAADINKRAAEVRTQRQEAQANLDDAAKFFNDAYKAADELRRDLDNKIKEPANQNRPERAAWEALKTVIDPQYYHLREASAQRLLGSLLSSEAGSLANRINLQASVAPAIERAGAEVPADLRPGDLSKNLQESLKLADEAFKNADELLTGIVDGVTPKETKESAMVEQVLTLYGWSQVAKLNGEQKAAQDYLKRAIDTRNLAAEQNIKLPALPAELGAPPAPPAPAVAPVENAPATAPSGETAPAAPAPAGEAPANNAG